MSTATATLSPKGPPRIGTKYQVYKAATAALAQWLAKQAQKLGISIKKGHHKTNHGINIDQFRTFTDRIVRADPTIIIPYEIVSFAQKASAVRKECAEILRGKDTESDKRHEHFISVIDEVFESLNAHYQSMKKADKKSDDGSKTSLVTKFELLEVEEGEDESNNEAEEEEEEGGDKKEESAIVGVMPKKKTKINKKKKSKAKKMARLEKAKEESESDQSYYLDEEEDPYFVMMCLLTDLSSMRAFVKEMWSDYATNKVDLVTVSLTTNATFDIIRTYEQDVPAISPLVKDYSKTLKLILGRSLGQEDKGLPLVFNSRNTPDEFDAMCSSLCWIESLVELACVNAFYFLNGPRHQMIWKKPGGGMGINLRRDPFGKYDPTLDRRELIYDDRLEHDIRILASFAADVYVGQYRLSLTPDHFTMQWDHFAQTGNKTVTLSEAYGAQLYLDVHHLWGANLSDAFLDVQGTAKLLNMSMTAWEDKEKPPGLFKDNPINKATTASLYTLGEIATTVMADKLLFETSKNALYLHAGKGDKFNSGKDLTFMEKNPFLCGITQFILIHSVRDAGMMLALSWKTILSAGQLYYACQMHREKDEGDTSRFLEEGVDPKWKQPSWKWDDMDYVFEMLGKKSFFEGHEPTSNHEIVRYNGTVKYLDSVSGKRKEDGRNDYYIPSMTPPKAGEQLPSRLDTRYDLLTYEHIEVSHRLFYAKYGTYHPSARNLAVTNSWTEGALLTLLGKKVVEEEQGSTPLPASTGAISHLALLKALKLTLRNEAKALRFNTADFHSCCFNLLRTIRSKIFPRIHELTTVSKELFHSDDDSKIMWLATKLYLAASTTEIQSGMWQVGVEPAAPVPLFTSKVHVAIDKVMRDYLQVNGCKDLEIRKINAQYGFVTMSPREQEYLRLKGMMMELKSWQFY